jgi:hypothetical protein
MLVPFFFTVNDIEICFHGMARSGNHAIMEWIMSMYPHKVDLWNCVGNIPQKFFFRQKSVLIHSYENRSLVEVFQSDLEKNHNRYFGKSRKRYDIILIRDPFNLFASRLQQVRNQKLEKSENDFYMGNPKYVYGACTPEQYVAIWKEHAKEYLNITSYMNHNKISISYNQWFTDRQYREKIADRLNVEYREDSLKKLAGEGKRAGTASSFDARHYDDRTQEMKTLERWTRMLEDPKYRSLFSDPEVWSLSEQIFGHLPGTERLRSSIK